MTLFDFLHTHRPTQLLGGPKRGQWRCCCDHDALFPDYSDWATYADNEWEAAA